MNQIIPAVFFVDMRTFWPDAFFERATPDVSFFAIQSAGVYVEPLNPDFAVTVPGILII